MQRSSGVTFFSILLIVLGALSLIYSVVDMVYIFRDKPTEGDVSVTAMLVYDSISALLSLLLLIAGIGVMRLKQWARYMALTTLGVVGAVQLVNLFAYLFIFKKMSQINSGVKMVEDAVEGVLGTDVVDVAKPFIDYFGPYLVSKWSVAFNLIQWVFALALVVVGFWFLLRYSTKEQFNSGASMQTPLPENEPMPDININIRDQIIIPPPGSGATINPKSMDSGTGKGPMAWLVVVKGSGERARHQINQDSTRIGRGQNNDIVLADSTVSEEHAKIYFQDDRFFIHDLGSRNGTVLNNQTITKSVLRNNDKIRFGKVDCIFMQA